MDELLDICDMDGLPTGKTVLRSEAHRLGVRHRTAHVWVVRKKQDSSVEILMQKRSDCKDSFPGCYDTSSAGHIRAGDEPGESAARELDEELGIHAAPDELAFIGSFENQYKSVFHGKPFYDNEFTNVFLYSGLVETATLKIQESELSAVEWFDIHYVKEQKMLRNKLFCVPLQGLAVLMDYLGMD